MKSTCSRLYFRSLSSTVIATSNSKLPNCNKKVCGHCEKRQKIWKSKVVTKKWLQGKFVLHSPRFTRIRHQELPLLKFLLLTYRHSNFLAATLDFYCTSFFTLAFIGHTFLQLVRLDLISLLFVIVYWKNCMHFVHINDCWLIKSKHEAATVNTCSSFQYKDTSTINHLLSNYQPYKLYFNSPHSSFSSRLKGLYRPLTCKTQLKLCRNNLRM